MYDSDIPAKPIAPDQYTEDRWEHTALRRRMIEGRFEIDLENELARHLPSDRRESWGPPDLSSNVLYSVTKQLAMLYHEEPTVSHNDFDVAPLVGRNGLITQAGLYPMMQRVQQLTIALRECVVRIDTPNNKELQYRVVTPDFVYCEARDDAPDEPVYYVEYRLRYRAELKKWAWIADVIDIRDPENPNFGNYRILDDGSLGEDVSQEYMGTASLSGENYPYRDSNGAPFLPIQIFRAEKTGHLWNAFNASQLVYGSLSAGVLWSFYTHVIRDCSWPQRYGVNIQLNGLSQLDQNLTSRRAAVSTDPSSIIMFSSDSDIQSQPLIGQFQAGADPQKLLESISKYEVRVSTAAGISGDILRQSGDPRSGYAISVSRDGQRQMSRRYAIIQRHEDESLLAKTAMMTNRFMGTNFPEKGYRITYAPIALSPEEMKAQREDVIAKLDAGLISPVQAIQILNPDLDEDGAKMELMKIRRQRAEFL